MKENIGKFEIPVHNFVINKSLEGIQDLRGVFEGELLRKRSFFFYFS